MNLHQALKQVKESHSPASICSNVGTLLIGGGKTPFEVYRRVSELAEGWPEYSGDSVYPVPCEGMSPEAAWHNLPLWEGEYGAARMRLLDFLIEATSES